VLAVADQKLGSTVTTLSGDQLGSSWSATPPR